MKIYFTTNVLKIEDVRAGVDFVFDYCEKLGHQIDKFNYTRNPKVKFDLDHDNEEMIEAYDHICKSIKKCDFMIAELTSSSDAVGFEIAFALNEKKPVLVLYDVNKLEVLSTPFRGNRSKYLKVKKYKDHKEIEAAINLFITDVHNVIDTKFILIIPPEIDRYLEWNAKERGKAKAEVTRDAIDQILKVDKKYQEYLKSSGIQE